MVVVVVVVVVVVAVVVVVVVLVEDGGSESVVDVFIVDGNPLEGRGLLKEWFWQL